MPIPFILNPSQRKEAARMYLEEKLSARQIAEHFGISAQAARNALKSEGVTFRDKFEARQIRDSFACKRYPEGREAYDEARRPKRSFDRPVPSVFHLGSLPLTLRAPT